MDFQAAFAVTNYSDPVGGPGNIALNHNVAFQNHGATRWYLPQKYVDFGESDEEGLVTSMFHLIYNPATLHHPKMEQ